LLHFLTVGERLFFEVLERRGGYDGYGAANYAAREAERQSAPR
jgi:4-hydroxyphenylpyruvate dioxygenase-like putative hemolysin